MTSISTTEKHYSMTLKKSHLHMQSKILRGKEVHCKAMWNALSRLRNHHLRTMISSHPELNFFTHQLPTTLKMSSTNMKFQNIEGTSCY
jgi:hypothetical protein